MAIRELAGSAVASISRVAYKRARPRRVLAYLMDCIDPRVTIDDHMAGRISIRATNPIECYRTDTLFTKEPETISWLRDTISPDSVFYDVGANIGVYSLFAWGLGAKVICFEPVGTTFAALCRNIVDNAAQDRIVAYPVCLSDRNGLTSIDLSDIAPGAALHGEAFVKNGGVLRQGSVALTMDGFIRDCGSPAPTHLKIDVDGPELAVLSGAYNALRLPTLRHVLVELEEEAAPKGFDMLAAAGFELVGSGATAKTHDTIAQNHIFIRR